MAKIRCKAPVPTLGADPRTGHGAREANSEASK
jgi:hypothetical protein